jgi:hypothetical protein
MSPGFFLSPGRRILAPYLLVDESSITGPVLVDEYSLVIPFFLTGLQSTSNPLKVILHVPSREHLVGQLSFPVVTQTTLVVAVTKIHPAVVWQWTLVVT